LFGILRSCGNCGKVVSLNYHFGAYFCECGWMDDSWNIERIKREKKISKEYFEHQMVK